MRTPISWPSLYSGALGVSLYLAVGFSVSLQAQTPTLDALIVEAEANWPALSKSTALREAAVASQLEATRAYRPTVSVGGTYTLAAGGRTIALPLGDLLNPAYGALNQLTQTQNFPTLENQEEPLLPNNFYDARVRVVQPLIQPEIQLSRKLAAAGIAAQDASVEVVRTELRASVRTAYFQLASARAAVEIYEAAEALTDEAYRTTSSLVRNGAALPLARERVVAERAQVQANKAAAEATLDNAIAQLNYLLGRQFDEAVAEARAIDAQPLSITNPDSIDISARAELDQLAAAIEVAALQLELESKFRRPRLGLQLDAGSQDFDFGLQPYILAGLNLNVPLYDGGRHGARTQRLKAEQRAANAQLEEAQRGFGLQLEVARHQLRAARAQLAAYEPAVAAAQRAYEDADKLYRAGQTGYVELLDAQNQLTTTRLQEALARYTTSIRYVELLQAAGR